MNKKIISSMLLILLTSCTLTNISTQNNNSDNNSYDSSNDTSNINLLTYFVRVLVGGSRTIVVESDYSFDMYANKELIEIKPLENNKYQIKGLKKGKTTVKFSSINGDYKEYVIEIISYEDIKSINDIYSLEENGNDSLNFTTLYVVENNNNIIKYVEDIYEHTLSKPVPYFSAVELHFSNGINSRYSSDYNIIGFKNKIISPNELKYGDILICHHDRSSEKYTLPIYMNVYNLFYVNLSTNQNIEYQDYLI